MKLIKENWVGLLFVIAGFVVAGVFYPQMPDLVPIHWNIHGVADNWVAKPWGPFVMPLIAAGVLAMLIVARVISPKGYTIDGFARSYTIVTTALCAFLFLITAAVALSGAGVPLDMRRVIPFALGVLFVVLGHYMSQFTRNFFAGIRTPWTLASEEVWRRTHRFGGKLFVALGVAVIAASLLSVGIPVLLVGVIATALVTVVYTYVVYQRLEHPG